jgi:3-deoxy-D-manno-octulosonic acid kinase
MNLEPRDLPEYERIDRSGTSVEVHPDFATHLRAAFLEGEGARPSELEGRGLIHAVDTPGGTVLIRRCLRGGVLGPMLNDRYFLFNRPREELHLHRLAYTRGVHTVLPVGAMWTRSGAIVRGALATLKVEACDLRALVESGERPAERDLAACGRAIRSMHAAGFVHADLQMKNILVGDGKAWVIDFDRARVVSDVGRLHARNNFLRLRRSFQKLDLPMLYFDAIRDAYEAAGGHSVGI